MFNQKKIKDERVENVQNSIYASAFNLTMFMLLISLFIKAVVLALPLKEFSTELFILTISSFYT